MKKKTSSNFEIDIINFILLLIKKKFLVFSFCFVGAILGYLLSLNKDEKIYLQTEIILQSPSFELFSAHNDILFPKKTDHLDRIYINKLNVGLLNMYKYPSFIKSLENNILEFTDNNNLDAVEFSKNISVSLKNDEVNFQKVQPGYQIYSYILKHLNDIDGREFLVFYVNYVKDITLEQIRNFISYSYNKKIDRLNLSPTDAYRQYIISNSESKDKMSFLEYSETFLEYKKQEIEYFKNILNKFENNRLDYNPVLYIVPDANDVLSKSTESRKVKFIINGLIAGLLISIIYLFFSYLLVTQKQSSFFIK